MNTGVFNCFTATSEQRIFNTAMSSNRQAVKSGFKGVKQQFETLDVVCTLKIRNAFTALMYMMGAVLWNSKVCILGKGQVGMKFLASFHR